MIIQSLPVCPLCDKELEEDKDCNIKCYACNWTGKVIEKKYRENFEKTLNDPPSPENNIFNHIDKIFNRNFKNHKDNK